MNIRKHKQLAAVALCAALASCGGARRGGADGLEGELSLSGAFGLYPLAVQWAQDFEQLHPGVRVDISAGATCRPWWSTICARWASGTR